MKRWIAYGYNMDSDAFHYNGRTINGLIVSIKAPSNITEEMLLRNVYVQFSKEDGFTISVKSNAKSILIQPYKTYFCAEPEDGLPGLEPIEVDSTTVTTYAAHYKEGKNCGVASSWRIK